MRIAIIDSHPIQYHVPVFRRLVSRGNVDFKVFFCSKHGVVERLDPGFGQAFQWDIPMLDGYEYEFLPDASSAPPGLHLDRAFPGRIKASGYKGIMIWGGYFEPMMPYTAFMARALGLGVIYRGDTYLNPLLSAPARALKYAYLASVFKPVDRFCAVGSWSREFYLHYGVPSRKIVLAPYAVDNDFFFVRCDEYRPLKEAIRSEIGLPPGKVIAGICGKLQPSKRHSDLLRAAAQMEPPDIHLLFVGDGELKTSLIDEAKSLGIEDRLTITGFVNQSQIAKYYAAMDVFAVCSTHNPWITVVNEAMCMELPVIASDGIGAAADLVKTGVNGIVYPMGDIAALTNALTTLTNQPDLRARWGVESRKVMEQWGLDQCCSGFERACLESVGEKRHP